MSQTVQVLSPQTFDPVSSQAVIFSLFLPTCFFYIVSKYVIIDLKAATIKALM